MFLKAIIDNVSSVESSVVSINGSVQSGYTPATIPIKFDINVNSPSSDNGINIPLKSGIYYPRLLLSIMGITTTNNVNNLRTSFIRWDTSNPHVISIVKYEQIKVTTQPYDPSPLTISRGITVTWTNKDSAPHTVTEINNSNLLSGHKFDSNIWAWSDIQTYFRSRTWNIPRNRNYSFITKLLAIEGDLWSTSYLCTRAILIVSDVGLEEQTI